MDNQYDPDSLADYLDQILPPGSRDVPTVSEEDILVALAARLASAPKPTLSPEAFTHIENQVLVARIKPVHSPLRYLMMLSAAAAVVVVALLMSVSAAMSSLPGDLLYPLKRAVEKNELARASESVAQVTIYIDHAERRIQEAERLLQNSQFDISVFDSAQGALRAAQEILETATDMDAAVRSTLEAQSLRTTEALRKVLAEAVNVAPPESGNAIALLATEVQITLSVDSVITSPTNTPISQETETPSQVFEPTATHTETPTDIPVSNTPVVADTATATLEPPPAATATPRPMIVLEGPIEEIEENILIIYGIEVELDPDDPILKVLRIGDIVRVEGDFEASATALKIIVDALILDNPDKDTNEVYVNPTGDVWRDSGDCSNAPPPWAPAHGWRKRCESSNQPGGGNAPGNSGNQGNGNKGMGKGKDSDK